MARWQRSDRRSTFQKCHQVSQSNWLDGRGLGKRLPKTPDKRLTKYCQTHRYKLGDRQPSLQPCHQYWSKYQLDDKRLPSVCHQVSQNTGQMTKGGHLTALPRKPRRSLKFKIGFPPQFPPGQEVFHRFICLFFPLFLLLILKVFPLINQSVFSSLSQSRLEGFYIDDIYTTLRSFSFPLTSTHQVLEVFYRLIPCSVFLLSLPSLSQEVFHQRHDPLRLISFLTELGCSHQSPGFLLQSPLFGLGGFSTGFHSSFLQSSPSTDSMLSRARV